MFPRNGLVLCKFWYTLVLSAGQSKYLLDDIDWGYRKLGIPPSLKNRILFFFVYIFKQTLMLEGIVFRYLQMVSVMVMCTYNQPRGHNLSSAVGTSSYEYTFPVDPAIADHIRSTNIHTTYILSLIHI